MFPIRITYLRNVSLKHSLQIKLHDNLETLYKKVPMELLPEEYLPDDYKGPTVGSLEQLRGKTSFINWI